jgi:hypothetical protein
MVDFYEIQLGGHAIVVDQVAVNFNAVIATIRK